jgi:hypothetical protein
MVVVRHTDVIEFTNYNPVKLRSYVFILRIYELLVTVSFRFSFLFITTFYYNGSVDLRLFCFVYKRPFCSIEGKRAVFFTVI